MADLQDEPKEKRGRDKEDKGKKKLPNRKYSKYSKRKIPQIKSGSHNLENVHTLKEICPRKRPN